jgi:hypothetical protein
MDIDNTIAELDNDISGLHDPTSQSSAKLTFDAATERRTALPRNVGIDCTIDELDNDATASDTSLAKRTAGSEPHTVSSRNMSIDDATETDNDTSSLHGSLIQSPSKGTAGTEPRTISPREVDVNNTTVSDRSVNRTERNTESVPHPDVVPHLQESAPAAHLPFKSPPPSSESMIEVAIQNVARAGYLSIIPHATAIKTLSQQNVIVKTTNSKSKKRTKIETEVTEQQTKKRAKITVPAREQSLRYDI